MAKYVVAASCVLAVACGVELRATDSRIATPERTVATLLESFGMGAMSQEAIRAHLAGRQRFEIVDRAAFELCFDDLDGTPQSEGYAGWVVGVLGAGRDELRTEIVAGRATVSPRPGVRVVLRRGGDGGWRIVLRESVPASVRAAMLALVERAETRARRTGAIAR